MYEHFIYTTAKTELKTGYQVIAKSSGISNEFINSMTNYWYPVGINPTKFTKAKLLLDLGKNHIGYSIVKNIGIGYDGREGTLYNHTIIMKKKDFARIEYDTRILDKYFIEEYSIRGELKQLCVQPEKIEANFEYLKKLDKDFLSIILFYLFKKNKIAIVGILDEDLIQNVLAIVPPQIRFIPFSTLVIEPTRQTKYHLIQTPYKDQLKLQSGYRIINLRMLSSSKIKQIKNYPIQNIIELINQNDQKCLYKIHKDFERVVTHISKNKKIKISDIFKERKIKMDVKNRKYSSVLKIIDKLYTNSEFNEMAPGNILKITKNIRIIIKEALKKNKGNALTYDESKKLILIFKIQLDSLNYILQCREIKIKNNMQINIKKEIKRIEVLINDYKIKTNSKIQYEFDWYDYFKKMCDDMLKLVWVGPLFILNRKW